MFEVSGMFAASSASIAARNATIGALSSDEERPKTRQLRIDRAAHLVERQRPRRRREVR